jgi:predicted SnoaL-like aldol condensation-catalyzing enzyme
MNAPTPHRHDDSRKQRPSEIVTRFLSSYHGGRMAEARAMLTDDFSFRAPLVDEGSQALFFASGDEKSALVRGFRVLRQWEDGDDVSTLYELDVETNAGAASMLMYEWHHVRDGSIDSTVMVFDTVAPAAELIRNELMHE